MFSWGGMVKGGVGRMFREVDVWVDIGMERLYRLKGIDWDNHGQSSRLAGWRMGEQLGLVTKTRRVGWYVGAQVNQ